MYDIKYLLLTHIHSDHIRGNTLFKIKKLFPKIKVIGNYEVHQHHGVDIIANAGYAIKTKDYVFNPFLCFHDVVTYGYTWEYKEKNIIYVTDTASLENAPEIPYDYLFIESNHCEKKIEQVLKGENQFAYDVYGSAKRHLSTQQAKAFYYMHRRDKDSKFIELHQSSRFY